jgi:Tfp pilus assembly protein PilO
MKMLTFSTEALQRLLPRWVLREWLVLVAALCAVLAGLCWLQQQTEQLNERQQALMALQTKQMGVGLAPIGEPDSVHQVREQQAASQAYLMQFPGKKVLRAILIDMNQLADQGALTASQSAYRYVDKQPLAELGQVEITAPVQGAYTQVKRYVQTLLNKYPTLALQDVAMQRSKVSDPNVIADMRWVFFYRLNASEDE